MQDYSQCGCIVGAVEDAVASDPAVAGWSQADQIQEGLYFLVEGFTEHYAADCPYAA